MPNEFHRKKRYTSSVYRSAGADITTPCSTGERGCRLSWASPPSCSRSPSEGDLGLVEANTAHQGADQRIRRITLSFPAFLVALLVFGIARGVSARRKQRDRDLIELILAIALRTGGSTAAPGPTTLVEKSKVYLYAARLWAQPFVGKVKHVLPNDHRGGAGDRGHQTSRSPSSREADASFLGPASADPALASAR